MRSIWRPNLNHLYIVLIGLSLIIWLFDAYFARASGNDFYPSDQLTQQANKLSAAYFPVQASKHAIQTSEIGYYYACRGICHATYEAADIGGSPGTPIIAVVGGKVLSAEQISQAQGKTNGATVRIQGSDGWWYYYAHLKPGSLKVMEGQTIRAGESLGVMGDAEDAQGTKPHLHFDMANLDNGFARGGNICSEACRNLVPPQPMLLRAYLALPEN